MHCFSNMYKLHTLPSLFNLLQNYMKLCSRMKSKGVQLLKKEIEKKNEIKRFAQLLILSEQLANTID